MVTWNEMIVRSTKRIVAMILVWISIAAVCIGIVAYDALNHRSEEALDLHTLVADHSQEEGQYVKLAVNTLPVLMATADDESSRWYFVTDVNDHMYIVNMSCETNKEIVGMLNTETGKLDSSYEITGVVHHTDDGIKNMIIANAYRAFTGQEVTSDNFAEYFDEFYIKDNSVSSRTVTLYQCLALAAVFFLVLVFGYGIPALVKIRKGDFGIFSEDNMRKVLGKYIPDEEWLIAGVYGKGRKMEIRKVFGGCTYTNGKIEPCTKDTVLVVNKNKYSQYNIYIGITERHFVISECEPCKYYYEFNESINADGVDAEEIQTTVYPEELGHCFLLTEIQSCKTKCKASGWTECLVTLKNGSTLKFVIPKVIYADMPNHQRYRETIMNCLNL